jgi:hypothetical protein
MRGRRTRARMNADEHEKSNDACGKRTGGE